MPETVLGQLGLKVEHALRAFTPKDRQVIKAVAQGFRAKPGVDVERIVTELETGEALVSALDAKGAPQPVSRALIAPPESRIGPLDAAERADRIARSPFKGKYDQSVDRESAFEILKARADRANAALPRDEGRAAAAREAEAAAPKPARRSRQSAGEAMMTSAARAIGSSLGRQLIRGILGIAAEVTLDRSTRVARYYFFSRKLAKRRPEFNRIGWRIEACGDRRVDRRVAYAAARNRDCASRTGLFAAFGPRSGKRASRDAQSAGRVSGQHAKPSATQLMRDIFGHVGVALAEIAQLDRIWKERERRIEFVRRPRSSF